MALKAHDALNDTAAADNVKPRDIAIFIDGTWNRAATRSPTNVRKLFEATEEGPCQGRQQCKLYIQGVGTRPRVDAGRLADADYNRELERYLRAVDAPVHTPEGLALLGGATGLGTAARIRATYHFLCKHFRHQQSDRVFLFGFSRGAFAARSLAGFVGQVGLLLADKLSHVQRAYEIYERSEDPDQTELSDYLYKLTGRGILQPDDPLYVPSHFLGVWDTVGALGLPSRMQWLTAPFTEYHQVECPPAVLTARHALALHELRSTFEPLLWQPGHHPDLQQVWFAGAHADVGGGYPAGEDGQSDTALRWMASEAMQAGLVVDRQAAWWTPSPDVGPIHHEIRRLFLATQPMPRSWLLARDERPWRTHAIHGSALRHAAGIDRDDYDFWPERVNAALRRVDAEIVWRAIELALMAPAGPEQRQVRAAEGAWWRSVSPAELHRAPDVVDAFLLGEGVASESEIEVFARGLALCQLLIKETAVRDAGQRASDLMRPVEKTRDAADAARWLQRSEAVQAGFGRCLDHLHPHQDPVLLAAVRMVAMTVAIYRGGLRQGAASDKAHADISAEMRLRNRQRRKAF